jgi:hypothetical protein
MKIVKVGANEYWQVPAGINVLDHLPESTRIMRLEKLPPDAVQVASQPNGIKEYEVDTSKRNASYQKRFREAQKKRGLIQVTVWVNPKFKEVLRNYAESLR